MEEKKYCVYCHTAPDGRKYIGATCNINQRWSHQTRYSSSPRFYSAILKFGWNNFKHEVLAQELDKKSAESLEKSMIELYQTNDERYGFNMIKASALHGYTEEQRKKISKARKGKHLTGESLERLIARNKSEEFRKEMSEKKKGKKNPSARKQIHELREKRKIDGNLTRRCKCLDAGKEYESSADAAKEYGISRSSVYAACDGKQKRAGGHKWMFIDPEIEMFKKNDETNREENSAKKYVDPYDAKRHKVRNLDTGEVFQSVRMAAESIGVNKASIYCACTGYKNQKKAGGFSWEYVGR